MIRLSPLHNVWIGSRLKASECKLKLTDHICAGCDDTVSILALVPGSIPTATSALNKQPRPPKRRKNVARSEARFIKEKSNKKELVTKLVAERKRVTGRLTNIAFPPKPLSQLDAHRIISKHCRTVSPKNFVEAGCAVCGMLVPKKELTPLTEYQGSLAVLIRTGITRKERFSVDDPIEELEGPVLAEDCSDICVECQTSLDNGLVPKLALVRHNWLGKVPEQLKDLTYAEGIMIARVRHNRCVIRVNSGRVRMSANAIMFSSPVLSIYNKLPPSKEDMNELLAFCFIGSSAPTQEDFERTPLLGYADLEISQENLDSYADRDIPVVVDYQHSTDELAGQPPVGTLAVNEMPDEHGTKDGKCSFAVHGMTGTEYATATMKTIKSVALQHLTHKGSMLGIGRSEIPQSMYDNVTCYPGMFPWLFPYGKGGIGHPSHSNRQGDWTRKRALLMYHDKRFQVDTYFPMIAFNHEQLRAASTGSMLLA
ncbi:hypothetical protein C8R43DRAFT_883781, partial [Mycena crocata]